MLTRLPTIADAQQQLRAGSLNPDEVVRHCVALARADRSKSWVRVAEDAELAVPTQGLLRGVAVAVKDLYDVAGWPTEAGSPLLRGKIAAADAPLVADLKKHGAVMIGKTATCQFASFDPAPTLNPWNAERTPGGSSAGSAAAVAQRQCQLALGSQTGGSITRPACYCGVAGFKPAYDPAALAGIVPLSPHLDHPGFMAPHVADLAYVWRVLRGDQTAGGAWRQTTPPTLGVIKDYFWEIASDYARAVTDAALDTFARQGAQLVEVPLPDGWSEVYSSHRLIMAAECERYHRENVAAHPEAYQPKIKSLMVEGRQATEEAYQAALEFQRLYRSHIVTKYPNVDVLVVPSASTTAPPRETTGDPRFQSPWSFSGLATVCFPSGLAPDGLPVGMQLIAPHGLRLQDEIDVLRIGAWCDDALELNLVPPGVS